MLLPILELCGISHAPVMVAFTRLRRSTRVGGAIQCTGKRLLAFARLQKRAAAGDIPELDAVEAAPGG